MIIRYYGSAQIYANSFQIMVLIVFLLISPLLRFFREYLAVTNDVEPIEITGLLIKNVRKY